MEISNPSRIFCLGWPDSGVLTLLQNLTGSAPTPTYVETGAAKPPLDEVSEAADNAATTPSTTTTPQPTIAGLSHMISLRTRYYNADVTVWLDELPSQTPSADSIQAWKKGFSQPGAEEVVRAVGAWLLVFRPDVDLSLVEELLVAVKAVIAEAHDGNVDNWDGVCLAVSMPSGLVGKTSVHEVDEWEDVCIVHGFEYVDGSESTQSSSISVDDDDERKEKVGIARIREALEANDWTATENDYLDMWMSEEADNGSGLDQHFEGFGESAGFGKERREMEQEFAGLKMAVQGQEKAQEEDEGEEGQVEELESMMRQIQMVKDMSAHMSPAEKRRFAAKAVNEMMKSI